MTNQNIKEVVPTINGVYNMTVYCAEQSIKNLNSEPVEEIVTILGAMSKAAIVDFLANSDMEKAFISEFDLQCKKFNKETLLLKVRYMLGNRIGSLYLAWENITNDELKAWERVKEACMR